MTYAPADLLAVRAYLLSELDLHPGQVAVDLDPGEVGIVGDTAHNGGYHCGEDRTTFSDYSRRESPRDRAGLTDAASALDIGEFVHGDLTLRTLTIRFVDACQRGDPRTADVREVIYTPDGSTVRRFDRLGIRTTGDSSHLYHTHISFFRDSEGRRAQPDNILGLLAELIEGSDGMALSDMDSQALIWRVHALTNGLDAVASGPTKGERIPAAGMLRQVAADVAALKTAVGALVATGGSADSAAIIAHMDQLAAAEVTREQEHAAEVADLRAKLAAAAHAAADAYDA